MVCANDKSVEPYYVIAAGEVHVPDSGLGAAAGRQGSHGRRVPLAATGPNSEVLLGLDSAAVRAAERRSVLQSAPAGGRPACQWAQMPPSAGTCGSQRPPPKAGTVSHIGGPGGLRPAAVPVIPAGAAAAAAAAAHWHWQQKPPYYNTHAGSSMQARPGPGPVVGGGSGERSSPGHPHCQRGAASGS